MLPESFSHDGLQVLERQARRLETACSIIQAIHLELTIEGVVEGIATSFVDVGGFASVEIALDAVVDGFHVHHASRAGTSSGDEALTRRTPVFIRGQEIGQLVTHSPSLDEHEELGDLLEFVLPTLFMGIDHAISFAEVLDYRETLEQKVEQRTAELAEAHRQLSQTFEDLREAKAARDRFFANINHEIRTPLTLIQLATDGVARSGDTLSAMTRQKLDDVNASSRRLLHLVDSLLMLAAGDEGKLHIAPRALDAAHILQRLVRNWQTAAERGQIVVSYDGPASCPATLDEQALETVIGNLVSNAVKFTPPGGTVTIGLRASDDAITIRVRDTGPGIDPEFASRMFGRFERAASAKAKGVRGSGIGLSLSKELIDRQNGTITVTRLDNPTGTSFEVVLPRHQTIAAIVEHKRAPAPEPIADQPAAAPAPAPAKIVPNINPDATIVLAEDDHALRAHITEILQSRYRVIAAPNGREALDLAKKHLPDLLVTDLEMPEMNGIELTRHFRALEGTSLSPVLIISAHAGMSERLAGFEAGAVDYVLKPFSPDELHARIRSQLALRKLALNLHENQKLAAMGMMSAGLAHELRNPANAMVNALEPLLSLLPESERTPEATGTILADIVTVAATQIRDLCKNILEFSRTGAVTSRPEDFRALMRRVRLVLSSSLSDVELIEDIALPGSIFCARPLIEQVLINLIDNSIDAAGRGGKIWLTAREESGLTVIEVSDTGPGVPVELQERIFDPFFTTKPVGEGTGLGLSVSRRIALNHGGDLRLVRRERGTAFRLELPQPL